MSNILILHEFGGADALLPRLIQIIQQQGHYALLAENEMELGRSVAEVIIRQIHECDAAIALISKGGPNIFYELGVLFAFHKPTLLLANKRIILPSDLAAVQHIQYDSNSVKSSTFEFKLASHLKNTLRHASSPRKPQDRTSSNEWLQTKPSSFTFSDILRKDRGAQGYAFERWLYEMSANVPGWDVVASRPGSDLGYDMAIWNNIEDPILNNLGNPIILESKVALAVTKNQIVQMLRSAQKAGVKGIVFATLSELPNHVSREIEAISKREHIVPIILSRKDFLEILTPLDFINRIRAKASKLLMSGGSGV